VVKRDIWVALPTGTALSKFILALLNIEEFKVYEHALDLMFPSSPIPFFNHYSHHAARHSSISGIFKQK
jgi:hypothetical protein